MKAKVQISAGYPIIHRHKDRASSVHTCTHQAQEQRRHRSEWSTAGQSLNNHLYMQHMHKNMHPPRNTYYKYSSDHVFKAAISICLGVHRVLIPCS